MGDQSNELNAEHPLAGDWADGLRPAPRPSGLPRPKRLAAGAPFSAQRAAPAVEAPDAWSSAGEDELASGELREATGRIEVARPAAAADFQHETAVEAPEPDGLEGGESLSADEARAAGLEVPQAEPSPEIRDAPKDPLQDSGVFRLDSLSALEAHQPAKATEPAPLVTELALPKVHSDAAAAQPTTDPGLPAFQPSEQPTAARTGPFQEPGNEPSGPFEVEFVDEAVSEPPPAAPEAAARAAAGQQETFALPSSEPAAREEPAASEEAPAWDEAPAAASEEPPAWNEAPAAASEEPPAWNEAPAAHEASPAWEAESAASQAPLAAESDLPAQEEPPAASPWSDVTAPGAAAQARAATATEEPEWTVPAAEGYEPVKAPIAAAAEVASDAAEWAPPDDGPAWTDAPSAPDEAQAATGANGVEEPVWSAPAQTEWAAAGAADTPDWATPASATEAQAAGEEAPWEPPPPVEPPEQFRPPADTSWMGGEEESAPAPAASPVRLAAPSAGQQASLMDQLAAMDEETPAALGSASPEDVPEELPPDALEPLPDDADLLAPIEDQPPADPGLLRIAGDQRVLVHTLNGRTRRGSVRDLDLAQGAFDLSPQGGGAIERVDLSEVKAIFFMLAPGQKPDAADGGRVKVTFTDGRSVEGQRQGPDLPLGFFLIPQDAVRTNTRRIFVKREALQDVQG